MLIIMSILSLRSISQYPNIFVFIVLRAIDMLRIEGLVVSLSILAIFSLIKLSELHESMRAVSVCP